MADTIRAVVVTARDVALLSDLWEFRYLTSRQLARLHFGHLKLAQRRLRALAREGLVEQFRPDPRGTPWYRVSGRGRRLLSRPPIRQRSPRSTAFLAHHALLVEFRIWLSEGCGRRFAMQFAASYGGRSISMRVVEATLIPDAAFTLERDSRSALFLLEVDRGTEPLVGRHTSALARKLQRYREAFDARADAHYSNLFGASFAGFRLLWVVPTAARADAVLRLAHAADLAPLVWVATSDVLHGRGDIELRCWRDSPGGRLRALTE